MRAMNHPLPSLRSPLRNISTSHPSCCLILMHLLQYKIRLAGTSLSSFGWRPHTELFHASLPCLSRRRKPNVFKGTTCISWIFQLHGHCTFSCFYIYGHIHADFSLLSHFFWQLARDFHNNKAQGKYSVQFWCLSLRSCNPGRT